MAKRVLITGGAGFIGSHLVRRLMDRGDEIHVIIRPSTPLHRLRNVLGTIGVHTVSLSDEKSLARCLRQVNPEHVYHLAVETRITSRRDVASAVTSVRGDLLNLMTLLAALAKLPRPPEMFVRAGSIAEYGTAPVPWHEDQKEEPATPYAASLAAGTMYLRALESELPFPAHTARLALVFGPGQAETFLIPALIRACQEAAEFSVRQPSDRRDLIYVEDVIEALILLAGSRLTGCQVINISTGAAPTMREVAEEIIDIVGADASIVRFDYPSSQANSVLLASAERGHSILGWSAQTSLRAGLQHTIETVRRPEAVLGAM